MHLSRRFRQLSNHFESYAKYQPTPVTLKSLIDFGSVYREEVSPTLTLDHSSCGRRYQAVV